MRFFDMRFFMVAALVMLGGSGIARADYFVWRDATTGMTVTYPDTWHIVSNEQPDDVLTIMAPSAHDYAACRIRIRNDMRNAIFPPRYNDDIQKIDYSADFWDKYLREFSNWKVYGVRDGAGLGRGFASMAEAGYWDAVPGSTMQKESMLFAALYNNRVYVLDCSARAQAYSQWRNAFLGVASSVDFVKANHELFNGYYRNFMLDERQRFQNPDDKTLSVY